MRSNQIVVINLRNLEKKEEEERVFTVSAGGVAQGKVARQRISSPVTLLSLTLKIGSQVYTISGDFLPNLACEI